MTQLAYQIFSTPLGEMLVAGTSHAIRHVILGDNKSRVCSDFLMKHENVARFAKMRCVQDACETIADYFKGKTDVTAITVEMLGTELERKVWDALRGIPFGETLTYGELAAIAGAKGSVDEVISACARNPVPLLIPSHRAVLREEDASHFPWGPQAKRLLQQHEAKHKAPFLNPEALYAGTRIYG